MKKIKILVGAVALFALVVVNVWNAATVKSTSELDISNVESIAAEGDVYGGMGLTNKMWETQYATMHSYEEYTESDGSTVVVVNWEYYVICKNITGGNHNCVEGTHGYKQESRVAYNNSSNVTKSIDKTTNLPGGATEHKYYEY